MSTSKTTQAGPATPAGTRPARDAHPRDARHVGDIRDIGDTRDVRGFWRVLLAVITPLALVATAASILVRPYPVIADAEATLIAVAAHPGAARAAGLLSLLSAFLMLPAVMATAWVARRRSPRLATVGAVFAIVGYGASVQTPNTDLVNLVALRAGLDRGHIVALVTAAQEHPVYVVSILLFVVGHAVGQILLGIALWRSRVAPSWMPLLLIVAAPAGIVATAGLGNNVISGIICLLTAVGFATTSVALLRARNDEFDLPAGPGQPAGAVASRPDTRTFWRVLLAVAAPMTPAVVAVGRYLLPYNTNDAPEQIVAKTLANPGFSAVTLWLGLLFALTAIPGVIAVAWVTRRRAPKLTTVAAILCAVGFTPLFAGGAPLDLLNVVTANKGLDVGTTRQILLASDSDPVALIGGITFVVGHILGVVLLGVALLRTRVVPVAVAIGMIISQPLHFVAAVILGNHPLDLLAWGLTAVGFAAASAVLLRTRNEDFDLPPMPRG